MGDLTGPRPLDASDDRAAFDCGRPAIDLWFRRHALNNQISGASRTSVLRGTQQGSVIAFVALSAGQVRRGLLPKPAQRNQPDPLPVLVLGQLAVDRQHQGRGYARSLMFFTFGTAVRVLRDIGCFGVLTHPLDDELRTFYRQFGFRDLPDDPEGGMLVRMRDIIENGFA